MKRITAILFFAILLFSCAFDGPSRPDIAVLDNIVLESGPGAAGKYTLAKREETDSGHWYTPLTDNDSLLKIVVKKNFVFVKTVRFDKSEKFYRFEGNLKDAGTTITEKAFVAAITNCASCLAIPIPKDSRP